MVLKLTTPVVGRLLSPGVPALVGMAASVSVRPLATFQLWYAPPPMLTGGVDRQVLSGGGHVKEVHAYTVARPTPEPFAARLSAEALRTLADTIRLRTGLAVFAFD